MTFRDLQRLMDQEQSAGSSLKEMQDLMRKLRDRPFYIWSSDKHKLAAKQTSVTQGYCCFNHLVPAGLPKKDGREYPLFDYEYMVYKALTQDSYLNARSPTLEEGERLRVMKIEIENKVNSKKESIKRAQEYYLKQKSNTLIHPFKKKHLWIKKATGLGITEFVLRFMAWLCLRNDDYKGSQMVIITGPNQELAIKLIKRMKSLFELLIFNSKETVLELNGCSIEAYPSNHIDAFRSLTNPKFILIDEGDFFRKGEQEEVRHVAERYIAKSDPFIVMVSTPNRPDGLFNKMEKESFESCIYKKLFLDYTYGLGKIYSQEEIEKARRSPSFPREYELQYQGLIGNVISPAALERCTKLGEEMDKTSPIDDWSIKTNYVMGIDPGYGSSNTSITLSRYVNGKVQIIYSKELSRPTDFSDIMNEVWRLKTKCGNGSGDGLQNIILDASATEMYTALCHQFNQNPSLSYLQEKQLWVKKMGSEGQLERYLFVVPIPFQTKGQDLLGHLKWIIEETDEDGKAMVAIDKRFDNVITSLRTAQATEYRLDKEATVNDDTLDSLRLNLSFYRRKK